MNEFKPKNGGIRRYVDEIVNVQTELLKALEGQWKDMGAFALSGCEVTDNLDTTVSITAGMVYIDGKILEYAGGTNLPVADLCIVKQGPVSNTPRPYANNTTQDSYERYLAVSTNTIPVSGEYIAVGTTGMKKYKLRGDIEHVLEIKNSNNIANGTNVDVTFASSPTIDMYAGWDGNKEYTIAIAGWYEINATIGFFFGDQSLAAGSAIAELNVNGTIVYENIAQFLPAFYQIKMPVIFKRKFSQGDIIKLAFSQSNSTGNGIFGGWTYLNIYRLN